MNPIWAARLVGTVAVALLLLALHLRLYEYAFDDAYIHLRIAAHLAEHGAPYFNLHEPVKVSSSSGWTILLSGMLVLSRWIGLPQNLPRTVAILNALMTVAGAVVYTSLLIRLCPRTTPFLTYGVFFPAYVAMTLWSSIGLMETTTTLVIVGVAIHLWLNRNRLSLTLLGAAIFWRPELTVVFGFILLSSVATRRFSRRDLVVYSVLGVTPFLLYDLHFFGTLVPHTARAKSVAYAMSYPYTLLVFARNLLPEVSVPAWRVSTTYFTLVVAVYVLGLLSMVGGALWLGREFQSWLRRQGALNERMVIHLVFFASGVTLLAAYLVTRTVVAAWYVPLFGVPLLLASTKTLLDGLASRLVWAVGVVAIPFWLVQWLGLLQMFVAGFVDPVHYHGFVAGARVRHYIKRGEDLYERYPRARLMSSEIGGLGYGFKGYIVDGLGLAYPGALRYHPMAVPAERSSPLIGAIPVGLVEEVRPELIVSYGTFVEAFLRSEIARQYERIRYPALLEDDLARLSERTWENEPLYVFVRRDFAATVRAP